MTHPELRKPEFDNQILKNFVSISICFFLSLSIGIFLVPFFIRTMGVSAYGIIPLVTSLMNYVGLIVSSLNSSVSRYLTVDLRRDDIFEANKTFNTAFFLIVSIILILVPFIFLFSLKLTYIFKIPISQEHDVVLLFLGIVSAFLITTLSSNFLVSAFAYNRLDLINLAQISSLITQTALIFALFYYFHPLLRYVGLAYVIGSLVALIMAIFLWKKLTPQLGIGFHHFDVSLAIDLGGMTGWIIIGEIGTILFLQLDLIIVNRLFGPLTGGEYALAFQWNTLLWGMAMTFSAILTPVILINYAKGAISEIIEASKNSVKFMGLAMALPVGLIFGFSSQLLLLWVGSEFVHLTPLMRLLVSPLIINLSILPLFSVNRAFNRVRIPGIITCILGISNLVLAISLPIITGWGVYGVAAACAITLTLRNIFFTPWYAAKILGIPISTFMNTLIPGIGSFIAIAGSAMVVSRFVDISSWAQLIIGCSIISFIYLCFVWRIGISHSERNILISYIPARLNGLR